MSRSARALIAAAATLIAVAVTAGPALASGFTLELTAPPAVVGHPIVLKATGTIPVEDLEFPYLVQPRRDPHRRHDDVARYAASAGGSATVDLAIMSGSAAPRFAAGLCGRAAAPG